MSDKSTENYLDNLLDSMNKLQDTDTKMSGADQDEFLKKFEDELENETYDECIHFFLHLIKLIRINYFKFHTSIRQNTNLHYDIHFIMRCELR